MSINLGAYSTEIVRAGLASVPVGQIEAGRSLGLKRLQIIRFIILLPAIRAVYPALCSQFILTLLGSSIVSAIAAEELTAFANTLNSQTFRSFEIYLLVTVLYIAMAFGFRASLRASINSSSPARLTSCSGNSAATKSFSCIMAARWTVALSLVAFVWAGIVGLMLTVARIAPWRWLRILTSGWIQLVQATPMLMLLLLFYFGINMLGLRIDAWTAAALSFTSARAPTWPRSGAAASRPCPKAQWEARQGARAGFPAHAGAGHHSPGRSHGPAADRRLHGAGGEGHVAGRAHRLHGARQGGHADEHHHLPAHAVFGTVCADLFRDVLAAVDAVAASREASFTSGDLRVQAL